MKKILSSPLALIGITPLTMLFGDLPFQDCCNNVDFAVYAEALYFQPSGSAIYYGVETKNPGSAIPEPSASPSWKTLDIDPKYHFGFEVGAKVISNESGVYADLNWSRFHASDSSSFTAPSTDGFLVGPFFEIGEFVSPYKVAHGNVRYQFDQVNFDFGKTVCFCNDFRVNMYGGITAARIKQSIHSKYRNVENTISRSIESPSNFEGLGPQLGADYFYQFCGGWSLVGNTALSCFIGDMKTHTTYKSFSPDIATMGNPQPNVQKTHVKSRTQLVPSFEQKLGVQYALCYDCFSADFEIGYRCGVYFNAVRNVFVNSTSSSFVTALFANPETGVNATSLQEKVSNFILSGPYLTFNVQF